jgi:hypothetical protein
MTRVDRTGRVGVWAAVLIGAICALSSCRHHTQTEAVRHKANVDYKNLFAKLRGTWISYEYILHLSKYKSPSRISAYSDGVFSFMIDPDKLNNDTLVFTAWLNGHEEKGMWIDFTSPDTLGRYSIGIRKKIDRDMESRSQLTDNIVRIKIDSPFLIIYTAAFDSVRYVYYDSVYGKRASDYPLRYYTTRTLFGGSYVVRDSGMLFETSSLFFDPEHTGRVVGSPLYDSFDINISSPSPSDTMDYMEFFDSRKVNESRSFNYKFKKNVLMIYPHPDSLPCRLYKRENE